MEVFPSLLQRVSVPGRGWRGHNKALFQGTVGGGTTSWLQHFGAPARRGEAPGFSEVHPWIFFFGFTWHRRRSELPYWLFLQSVSFCWLPLSPPCAQCASTMPDGLRETH